jgi:enterochelin esterase-like enzyme
LETFTLASEILGNEREIDVYLPAGYDDGETRYPVLVVNDGKSWLEKAYLANTLNQLIGRDMAPVIVAGVEIPHGTGRDEVGGEKSPEFVRMLAEELVPQMDEKYRILAEPGARGVLGVGRSALLATYAAVQRPDVFGMSVGCSVYLPEPGRGLLYEAIEKGSGENQARFWVVWNENDLLRTEWDVDLARDSRSVAEALEAGGFTVVTEEAADSAGWGGWRVRAGEALKLMFPR